MDYASEYRAKSSDLRRFFSAQRDSFRFIVRDTVFVRRLMDILYRARDYKGAVDCINQAFVDYRDNKPLCDLSEELASSLIHQITKALREGREVSYPQLKYYYCRLRGFTHQDAVRSAGYFQTDKVCEPVFLVTRTGSYRVISYQFIAEYDNSFSVVSIEVQGQLEKVCIPETMQARVSIYGILSKIWPPGNTVFIDALTDRTITHSVKCFR